MIEAICSGTKTGKIGRKRGRAGLAAFSLLTLDAVLATAGQTAPLPKAESILDAFVEKSGGRAVFDKIANRRRPISVALIKQTMGGDGILDLDGGWPHVSRFSVTLRNSRHQKK